MSSDVSVIIAAYNVENYIARAVKSALGQTGVNVQVIVADDCSTDKTRDVLGAIDDPRLEILRLPKNSGPSAARNAGLRAAKGKWIAVLDGDDAIAPDRLHSLLDHARQENADIVMDNLMVLSEEAVQGGTAQGNPMFAKEQLERNKILTLENFIQHNQSFLGGYTFGYMKPMIRADFLKKHDLFYDETIRVGEDYMLMASALALSARCVIDPRVLYYYTSRKGSVSHRLTCVDIDRIAAGDKKFEKRYGALFSPATRAAHHRRNQILERGFFYTQLVDGIKNKNITQCARAVWTDPLCAIDLWRPVAARVRRLMNGGRSS